MVYMVCILEKIDKHGAKCSPPIPLAAHPVDFSSSTSSWTWPHTKPWFTGWSELILPRFHPFHRTKTLSPLVFVQYVTMFPFKICLDNTDASNIALSFAYSKSASVFPRCLSSMAFTSVFWVSDVSNGQFHYSDCFIVHDGILITASWNPYIYIYNRYKNFPFQQK